MSNNPQQRFCLKVWGDLAAFNRPELKVERFTYDGIADRRKHFVIKPLAMRVDAANESHVFGSVHSVDNPWRSDPPSG